MKKYSKKIISSSSFLIVSLLTADGFNFLFSAYIARKLNFSELGLITLFTSLWNFATIFLDSYAVTINHRTAFLIAKGNIEESNEFYRFSFLRGLVFSCIIGAGWLILAPLLSSFFDIDQIFPMLLFTPLIVMGVSSAASRGYLQGSFSFTKLGLFMVLTGVIKLFAVIVITMVGLNNLAYLAIVISEVSDFIMLLVFVYSRIKTRNIVRIHNFPVRFFGASMISRLATTAFLFLDVILAKHFLSREYAGQYALLSFVGKIVFYFGSLLNAFIVSLVSRDEGLKKDPFITFIKLFSGTIALTSIVYICIGPLGYLTIPLLFGTKAVTIVPYLLIYGLAICLFTLANQLVTYHLARRHYIFPISSICYAGAVILAILLFHANISQIVSDVFWVSVLNLVTLFIFHIADVEGKYIIRTFVDFTEVLLPLAQQPRQTISGKRILIFNWRDTRHVYSGGAEVYIHEIAKRWVKKGNKVTWFCGHDGISARHEVIDGIEIIRRGGIYFVYIWAFVYYIIRFRGKYDIIIDTQNGIPFFTPLFAKEKVYCLMFHVHQEMLRRYLVNPLYMIAYILEQKAMPIVYRNIPFLTISESTKSDMKKLGLGKAGIDIIYPGVNLKNLRPDKKSKHPLILYLGRLKDYKSVHILIKSGPSIFKKFPKAEIMIAGFGEEEKHLKKLVKTLHLEKKVSFLGKVSEAKKIELYQKAWVFVNPSFIEGWGITTIEANACGTPVVASDVPGLHDSVKNPHTGFLVKYGDIHAFSEKITLLLENPGLLQKMSKEALQWSSKFDWEKSALKCLKIIENV